MTILLLGIFTTSVNTNIIQGIYDVDMWSHSASVPQGQTNAFQKAS